MESEYRDITPPENELDKECPECGSPHANKGAYCSLHCASTSMF